MFLKFSYFSCLCLILLILFFYSSLVYLFHRWQRFAHLRHLVKPCRGLQQACPRALFSPRHTLRGVASHTFLLPSTAGRSSSRASGPWSTRWSGALYSVPACRRGDDGHKCCEPGVLRQPPLAFRRTQRHRSASN